ncbi:hypothetical protein L1987_02988 [Smallanthus sonchifolius]|uniref:Uncharacterized protein n=1 Tax=Smallanthus sonchifolius TaxID=185202 RepID=A0ACB9K9D4_9ASTR|nr:hypothetical protein L1987_02988 [Smallanthus sonchifolius]
MINKKDSLVLNCYFCYLIALEVWFKINQFCYHLSTSSHSQAAFLPVLVKSIFTRLDAFIQQSLLEEKCSSVDATLLVCLGMAFGILYSFMESKREVEKLNRLL